MRAAAVAIVFVAAAATACDSTIASVVEPESPGVAPTEPVEPSTDAGVGAALSPDVVAPPARPKLRVLFIGNSYTYVNDVPGILRRIAASAHDGPTIETDEVVAGGAVLAQHWSDGIARARIAEGSWTHVVIQGQSFEPTGQNPSFLEYAKLLGDAATQAGARATWFVTWARERGQFHPLTADHDVRRMQDELTSAYAKAAVSVPGSLLTCVGEAFRASLRDHPDIALHDADHSHSSLAGAYLAAATFYVALSGAPVPAASAVPDGLDLAVAAKLRDEANVGSNCADVRVPADVRLFGEGFRQDDSGKSASAGDFGTSVQPVVRSLYLSNSGFTSATLSVPTLAVPFAWTSGAYPGGVGVDPVRGTPFCGATLAPNEECAVSIRFDGSTSATGALKLPLSDAYQSEIEEPLIGRTTDRAHLALRLANPNAITYVNVGEASTFHAVVSNAGARSAGAISVNVEPVAPFEWSSGAFPGGTGSPIVDGTTLDHCTSTLAAGARCVLSFRVNTTQPNKFYSTPIELTYASSPTDAEPNVVDMIRATLYVRSRIAP